MALVLWDDNPVNLTGTIVLIFPIKKRTKGRAGELLPAASAVVFCCTCLLLIAPQGLCAQSSETGWMLDQQSEERGRTIIKVTERNLVLTSKLMSAILASPKFDAVFFNETTKKFVILPHNDWAKRYASGKKEIEGPFPGEKIAGLNTRKFTWRTKNRHKTMELWVTKELPLSTPLQEFVSTTIGIPTSIGMPLRMVTKFDDRPAKIDMDTKSIKKTKFPLSTFELPKGFKKVKSEMELLLGGEEENGIDEFIK